MSKKWPFKKSPGVVVTALIEDVEDLQDIVRELGEYVNELEKRIDEDARVCATHTHRTYFPHADDGLDDIGPVL